jgi:hypothetical protein
VKTRYDKLVVVRRAENRIAAATFAAASVDVSTQHALASRLRSALDSLALTSGPTSAAEIAARMELASRMATAQGVARTRIDAAQAAQLGAGIARKSARRALDAAHDIQRVTINDLIRRREAKAVAPKLEAPFK